MRRVLAALILCVSSSMATAAPVWFGDLTPTLLRHQKETDLPAVKAEEIKKTFTKAPEGVNPLAIAAGVNERLKFWKLGTNAFITPSDVDYWYLNGKSGGDTRLADTGLSPIRRGQKWYVQSVRPGSAAAKAGIKRGDEIAKAAGTPPTAETILTGKNGEVILQTRRQAWEQPKENKLKASSRNLSDWFRQDMERSETIFALKKKRLGYVHVRNGADEATLQSLSHILGRLQQKTDVLILDLRDSLPTRKAGLLGLFLEQEKKKPLVTKPIVVLVNQRTRGVHEWLAGLLQKERKATIIGEATAGEFLEKEFYPLKGDALLVLPQPDPSNNLPFQEGIGLKPDVAVSDDIPYSAGADSILEKAQETAEKL